MSYTKEEIQLIVNEQIDSIKESLCEKLCGKLCTPTEADKKPLLIDINLLQEYDKKALIKYANDKGIINVIDVSDKVDTKLLLKISAKYGHLEIVKFLVESGAKIDGTNALSYSVAEDYLEIVKFLVKHYLEQKLAIPDNCITKEINDTNRFLFMHSNENQHHLFNEEIVSSLSFYKI